MWSVFPLANSVKKSKKTIMFFDTMNYGDFLQMSEMGDPIMSMMDYRPLTYQISFNCVVGTTSKRSITQRLCYLI